MDDVNKAAIPATVAHVEEAKEEVTEHVEQVTDKQTETLLGKLQSNWQGWMKAGVIIASILLPEIGFRLVPTNAPPPSTGVVIDQLIDAYRKGMNDGLGAKSVPAPTPGTNPLLSLPPDVANKNIAEFLKLQEDKHSKKVP